MSGKRTEHGFGGLAVVATSQLDSTGRPRITKLEITAEQITTEALRTLNISVILAAAQWETDPADLDTFVKRQRGEDPVTFCRRLAKAYRTAASRNARPNKLIAEQAGVPVGTVRGWVREARLRGLLEPGTQGRAG